MKMTKEKWDGMKAVLSNAGYPVFADLITDFWLDHDNKDNCIIGFVGDDLVGKSSIINLLLDDEILPTSIIPSTAKITLKYGEKKVISISEDVNEKDNLAQLIEEEDSVEILVPNGFLKNNSIVVKEFHGLFSKQKLNNIVLMSEIYNCDIVVMVMTAEHFLSESECLFIENYLRYVGTNRLLLIINKLMSVGENNIERVLDYAQKQLSGRFPNVRWAVYDDLDKELIRKYNKNIREEVLLLLEEDKKTDDSVIKNMLQYIKEQLQSEMDLLEKIRLKELDESKREKEKLDKKRKLETMSIEDSLVEFKQKRNRAIEQVDNFLKEQFEMISTDLVKGFAESSNKYRWYEEKLEISWKKAILDISKKAGKYASEIISKDIEWLNGIFQTKLGSDSLMIQMIEGKIKKEENIVPYKTYKKCALIGTGGAATIGYCMFQIIGASIGLCAGILTCSYLEMKDNVQTEKIKKDISSKIRDISAETRKVSRKDVESVYDYLTSEFRREAKNIIDSKYKFMNINECSQKDKIDKIQDAIHYIEEV